MDTIAGGTLELDLPSEEVVVVASEDGRPSKKPITLSSSNVTFNGLLLCSTRVTCDEYYVYNPSTDLCKMLPSHHVLDLKFQYAVSKIRIAFDPRRSAYYKFVSADIKRDP
nr:hypothetical protein [Tanacetum cinerariifolium]